MTTTNHVQRAADLFGNQVELAAALKVSPQAFNQWVKKGEVPAERCREVERLVGQRVTRFQLNPRVFGARCDCPACMAKRKRH